MNIPPSSELMDFDSFASLMNADSIDNIHKYYGSEDEQDLESNFSGTDSDTDSDKENTRPYSTDEESLDLAEHKNSADDKEADDSIDTREVDGGRVNQNHAKSTYLDSKTHDMVKRTEDVLARLSLQAQAILEDQPLSTQIVLTNQACDQVLRPYGQHGSQARFSESVKTFLNGDDTVRRPGKMVERRRTMAGWIWPRSTQLSEDLMIGNILAARDMAKTRMTIKVDRSWRFVRRMLICLTKMHINLLSKREKAAPGVQPSSIQMILLSQVVSQLLGKDLLSLLAFERPVIPSLNRKRDSTAPQCKNPSRILYTARLIHYEVAHRLHLSHR